MKDLEAAGQFHAGIRVEEDVHPAMGGEQTRLQLLAGRVRGQRAGGRQQEWGSGLQQGEGNKQ
jgi:hypothetical protein